MAKNGSRWNTLRIYLGECLRLLYWAYFKPFTFSRRLQEIDPDLKPHQNPFTRRADFAGNPRLRRYAEQVWLLSALAPVVTVLLIELYRFLTIGENSNWLGLLIFLIGWETGLGAARGGHSTLEKQALQLGAIIILVVLGLAAGFRLAPESMRPVFEAIFSWEPLVRAVGAIAGFPGGIQMAGLIIVLALFWGFIVFIALTLGMGFGLTAGTMTGIALGISFGLSKGKFWIVLMGLMIGMGASVYLGLREKRVGNPELWGMSVISGIISSLISPFA